MKTYSAQSQLTPFGLLLLVPGSITLGILIGALAYFVSSFIYLIVLFPLVIASAGMIAYFKLIQFAKIRHSVISILLGLVTGVIIACTFYGIPYLVLRNRFVTDAQKTYQVDAQTASNAFEDILKKETGSGGLIGYLALRARAGDKYTNYLMVNATPIHEFSFTLKSTWAWLYWLLEVILITVPIAWIGYDVSQRPFNRSANDWYKPLPEQVGSVTLESKERLLALLQANDLQGASKLMVAEEEIPHPMLEIYEQHSDNKKGDILLTVKQTFQDNQANIKRTILGQWEVSQQEYSSFVDGLSHRLVEHDVETVSDAR